MITVSIKDFVLNGNFGPVKIGMMRDEVVNLLGEPDDEKDLDNDYCLLWYAYYEFTYLKRNGVLLGIQNSNLAISCNLKTKRVNNKKSIYFSNNYFTIDIWFLKKGRYLTYKEVVQILEKEKIDFEIVSRVKNDLTIRFRSGLEINFDDNSGHTWYDRETKKLVSSEPSNNINDRILLYIGLWDMSLAE
jgi:hypothetical protein